MRYLFGVFLIFIFGCNSDSINNEYIGFIAQKANTKIRLEHIESSWAGGGTSQKISILRDSKVIYETQFKDEQVIWLIDSLIEGDLLKIKLIKSSPFIEKENKWKVLHESNNEKLLIEYKAFNRGPDKSSDSCNNFYVSGDSISFELAKNREIIRVPKWRVMFLFSLRGIEVYFVDEEVKSMYLSFDEPTLIKLRTYLNK